MKRIHPIISVFWEGEHIHRGMYTPPAILPQSTNLSVWCDGNEQLILLWSKPPLEDLIYSVCQQIDCKIAKLYSNFSTAKTQKTYVQSLSYFKPCLKFLNALSAQWWWFHYIWSVKHTEYEESFSSASMAFNISVLLIFHNGCSLSITVDGSPCK